jgi:hypothetical protein
MLKRNQILANSKLKKEGTVKKSEMKRGSVNLMKRVSASLLGAAVALCLTAANLAAAQATVDLGQAGHFAVLAHTTVTNTGDTKINGDLGVDPGTAVVGFFPVDGGPE